MFSTDHRADVCCCISGESREERTVQNSPPDDTMSAKLPQIFGALAKSMHVRRVAFVRERELGLRVPAAMVDLNIAIVTSMILNNR